MRPVASMRAPAQITWGFAREIFTSWKLLIEPQVPEGIGVTVQLPPKSDDRHTPVTPTAQRKSGARLLLAILVMNGALPPPVSHMPLVAPSQEKPPSSERCRPLYW